MLAIMAAYVDLAVAIVALEEAVRAGLKITSHQARGAAGNLQPRPPRPERKRHADH